MVICGWSSWRELQSFFVRLGISNMYYTPKWARQYKIIPDAKIIETIPRNRTAINSVDIPITSSLVRVKLRIVGAVYQQLLLLTSRATADEYTYQ